MYKKFKTYDDDPKNNLKNSDIFVIQKILKDGSKINIYTSKLTQNDLTKTSYFLSEEFDDEFEQSSTLYLKQYNRYLCKVIHKTDFCLYKNKDPISHGICGSSIKDGSGDVIDLKYPLHVIKTMFRYNEYDMETINGDHLIYKDSDGTITLKYNDKVLFEEKDLSDIDKLKEEFGNIIKLCVFGKQDGSRPDITLFQGKIIKDKMEVLTNPAQIHYYCPEKFQDEITNEFKKQGFKKGSCGVDWN